MTIALGILATDGIVIAADTQESWGYLGGAKISGNKILTRVGDGRACSATGSGSAGYLDSLNQELTDNFLDVPDTKAVERRLREKLRKFYAAHVLPMSDLPEHERPSTEIIIGTSWEHERDVLFANELSTLRRCKHYIAVGAGRAHASMLLSRLLPPKADTTTDLATFLAAYVVFHVKSYVEGCGMDTHVTILTKGKAFYVSELTMSLLEEQFQRYMQFDATAVNYLSGRPLNDEQAGTSDLCKLLGSLRHDTSELMKGPSVLVSARPGQLDWADQKSSPSVTSLLVPVIDEAAPTPSASPRRSKSSEGRQVRQGSKRGLKGQPPSQE